MKNDYYVYVYLDPDTRQPFYVGNGRGNRCRTHLKISKASTEKQRKIVQLFAEHRNPIIQIVQWEMSKREAEKAEAAFIEFFGLRHLSNVQGGRGTVKINADFLEYILHDGKVLRKKNDGDPVVIVQVGDDYRPGMSQYELYDFARGPWRMADFQNAKGRKTILVVNDRWVIDVYRDPVWMPAGACASGRRRDENAGQYEFVAQFAHPKTRNKYIGRRVSITLKKGYAQLAFV